MSGENEDELERLSQRIEDAPNTSREELLEALYGSEEVAGQTVRNGVVRGDTAPPAEWIDLLDAGPYVDETKLPQFMPNGDGLGAGGDIVFDNEHTREWWAARLKAIGGHAVEDPSDPSNFQGG